MVDNILKLVMASVLIMAIYSNIKLRIDCEQRINNKEIQMKQQCDKEKFEEKYKRIMNEKINYNVNYDSNSSTIYYKF